MGLEPLPCMTLWCKYRGSVLANWIHQTMHLHFSLWYNYVHLMWVICGHRLFFIHTPNIILERSISRLITLLSYIERLGGAKNMFKEGWRTVVASCFPHHIQVELQVWFRVKVTGNNQDTMSWHAYSPRLDHWHVGVIISPWALLQQLIAYMHCYWSMQLAI